MWGNKATINIQTKMDQSTTRIEKAKENVPYTFIVTR